jgi:hypothetical protein
MGELDEPQWAVVSERGCEASGLAYVEALDLMRRRTQEKVSGLAIVTAAAARRFTHATPVANQSISSGTARPKT